MGRQTEINDGNVIAKLEELQRLERDTSNYFRSDSALWEALVHYIVQARCNRCVLGEKKHPVRMFRGIGSGVSYKRSYAKPAGAHPHSDTTLRLCFDVTFYDDEQDRDYSRHWMVDVPIDLVEHFTAEKFNEWLALQQAEFDARQKQEILSTLRDIAKDHPEVLREFLKERCV